MIFESNSIEQVTSSKKWSKDFENDINKCILNLRTRSVKSFEQIEKQEIIQKAILKFSARSMLEATQD